MHSHRYTTKQSKIPEHIGGKITLTPSPEFPKQLEETEEKPVMCATIDNGIMCDGSAPTAQQETKAKVSQVSYKLYTNLAGLTLLVSCLGASIPFH